MVPDAIGGKLIERYISFTDSQSVAVVAITVEERLDFMGVGLQQLFIRQGQVQGNQKRESNQS